MTIQVENMTRRFARVFAPEQATVLAETISDAYADLVKTSDFDELKEIVRNLTETPKCTQSNVEYPMQDQRVQIEEQRRFVPERRTLGQVQNEQVEPDLVKPDLVDADLDIDARLNKLSEMVANLSDW